MYQIMSQIKLDENQKILFLTRNNYYHSIKLLYRTKLLEKVDVLSTILSNCLTMINYPFDQRVNIRSCNIDNNRQIY